MGELKGQISTDVSPERLWAVVTDWAEQGRWIPFTRAWVVGGGPAVAGSRVEARTAIGPVGFLDVMIIETWDPPHRLELRHVGKIVRGSAGFLIEPLGDRGSRIIWAERIDMPLGALGRLAWPVVAGVSRWLLQSSLRKLAAVASAAAPDR
jgi:hypothetical protein